MMGSRSPLDFSGKIVFVIGGSSGIGNGIARGFLNSGAEVHICGTKGSAESYAGGDGNLDGLHYRQLDVADPAAIETFNPPFKKLDVLVQSQGIIFYSRGEFELKGFRRVLEVNLVSLMSCAMKFHPLLVEAQGSMVIISSSAAFHATKGNPAYNASKAGAAGLTRTLGQAWASDGVRVNGIAPGFVETKLTTVTTNNERRRAEALSRIPIGRFGRVEEMAGIAMFLASPLSGYIVGQTLLADGGMLL
jgi:3-oxoacyl-[acyl-carrier protein] reductase